MTETQSIPEIDICLLAEDGARTEKLEASLRDAFEASTLWGCDSVRVRSLHLDFTEFSFVLNSGRCDETKETDGAVPARVCLSRLSGSAAQRDHPNHDVLMRIYRDQTEHTCHVMNGESMVVENQKPEQFSSLASGRMRRLLAESGPASEGAVRLPQTACVSMVDEQIVNLTVRSMGLRTSDGSVQPPVAFTKPSRGGGSSGVLRVPLSGRPGDLPLSKCALRALQSYYTQAHTPILIQEAVGEPESSLQLRVELICGRVHSVLLISKIMDDEADDDDDDAVRDMLQHPALRGTGIRESENLCICDVGDTVDLRFAANSDELATELARHPQSPARIRSIEGAAPNAELRASCAGLFGYCQAASKLFRIDGGQLALEFRVEGTTDGAAVFGAIDVNFNTNYSAAKELELHEMRPNYVTCTQRLAGSLVVLASRGPQESDVGIKRLGMVAREALRSNLTWKRRDSEWQMCVRDHALTAQCTMDGAHVVDSKSACAAALNRQLSKMSVPIAECACEPSWSQYRITVDPRSDGIMGIQMHSAVACVRLGVCAVSGLVLDVVSESELS